MEIIWNLPGYGPIPNAQPLRIAFRPYSPKRGPLDVATSVWSNREGQVPTVEQPAYAVYDTANLVVAVERYFSSLQPAIEEWIFARISRDEIAYSTYQEVIRMRRVTGSKALDLAMRLQCLSVVSQGYGSVFSPNIPGIREYDYSRLGHSDYEAYDRGSCDRPLPGAITHQMDVAAVKYLRKLEKLFVKELAALIFKPKIKPWYELFLTFYVIFWNLEYIHHGAQDYIKSKNGTVSCPLSIAHCFFSLLFLFTNTATSCLRIKSATSSQRRSKSGNSPSLCFYTIGVAFFGGTRRSN